MEEKKADNTINMANVIEIEDINDQIDREKNYIKKLNELEDSLYDLKKNINESIELLNASIKGGNIGHKLDSIKVENNQSVYDISKNLDEAKLNSEQKLRELYDEKENKLEEEREENKEEE